MSEQSDCDPTEKLRQDMLGYWRPTDSWVRVHLRRFGEYGILWDVQRRGDPLKGTVILTAQECVETWIIFTQICTADDTVSWMRALSTAPLSRQQADHYLKEEVAKDPDVWIIQTELAVTSRIEQRFP